MKHLMTVMAGLACSAFAVAQNNPQPGGTPGTGTATGAAGATARASGYHRVTTVIGTNVMLGSDHLGQVTEVVFNEQGCIEYMVVRHDDRFVAIPWRAATVNYDARTVTIQGAQVTRERFRDLTFTEAQWPNFADAAWTQRMRTVWGADAFRTGTGTDTGRIPNLDRKGTGDRPGTSPGTNPSDRPGSTPGTNPGTNPNNRPGGGTNPSDRPGSNTTPGTNPGATPGSNPGNSPGGTNRPSNPSSSPSANPTPGATPRP